MQHIATADETHMSHVQAVRSNVFKYMLDSDECKTLVENSITIPDLTYEELKALLEFFCSGILSSANKQHARALYLAAHKYDIPYLQELCRDQLISSLNQSNVLDILELSTVSSDKILEKTAIRIVVINMETIIYGDRYKSFVRKNPDLGLDITKILLDYIKSRTSRGLPPIPLI
ncbi:unnamed protein product [Microthlaspi erraticum]|uniref:BTB domain-containing protein n=1 Tax=Microthlaspi erraticum TaxID=1685480 RepID=A0A6D2KUH0_9BRAS|nr:unnamed protein product [Microthlaspi erraticum]